MSCPSRDIHGYPDWDSVWLRSLRLLTHPLGRALGESPPTHASTAAMTSTVASPQGLIAPHGGSLVDLRVPAEQRDAAKAGVDHVVHS